MNMYLHRKIYNFFCKKIEKNPDHKFDFIFKNIIKKHDIVNLKVLDLKGHLYNIFKLLLFFFIISLT